MGWKVLLRFATAEKCPQVRSRILLQNATALDARVSQAKHLFIPKILSTTLAIIVKSYIMQKCMSKSKKYNGKIVIQNKL